MGTPAESIASSHNSTTALSDSPQRAKQLDAALSDRPSFMYKFSNEYPSGPRMSGCLPPRRHPGPRRHPSPRGRPSRRRGCRRVRRAPPGHPRTARKSRKAEWGTSNLQHRAPATRPSSRPRKTSQSAAPIAVALVPLGHPPFPLLTRGEADVRLHSTVLHPAKHPRPRPFSGVVGSNATSAPSRHPDPSLSRTRVRPLALEVAFDAASLGRGRTRAGSTG